jgi:hypothetical protein
MTNSHWIELKSSINEQLIWMPHPSKGMVGGFQEFASITKSAGLEFLRWQVRSTTKAIQDRVLFPQRSLGIAKEMQSCFVSSGTSFIISFQLKIIVPLIRPLQDLHTQPVFFWRIFATWQEKKGSCKSYKGGFLEKMSSSHHILRKKILRLSHLDAEVMELPTQRRILKKFYCPAWHLGRFGSLVL